MFHFFQTSHKKNYKRKQRGSIMPVTAIALVSIMGMTGMVIDSSRLFLNRSKLQSLLDAAALTSAKVLDETGRQFNARQAANRSIANNLAQPGFESLRNLDLNAASFIIQFSATRSPFIANPASSSFVRIQLNPGTVVLNTTFLNMMGINGLGLSGSALAGPSPALGNVCNLVPSVICADPNEEPDDDGMFGYEYGEQVSLAMGSVENNDVGPGNFQLLDLGLGGNDDGLRASLAGGASGCTSDDSTVETQPGVNRGPVAQGFNTRFGIYTGPVSAADYPPDLVVDAGAAGYPDSYSDYKTNYATNNFDQPINGLIERRVMPVAFGNCDGTVNGQGSVELIGFGCIFLNQPAQNNNALQIVQVSGELVRSCRSSGVPGPNPIDGPGVHTIQLYGDPNRWDS